MPRTIRADDLHDLDAVGRVAVSSDGERIAFTIGWPDRSTDENRSMIHLYEGGSHRPLTDGHRDGGMEFSPDGTRLAYLSAEPKEKPIPKVVDLTSMETVTLDGFDDGAEQLRWLDDDRLLVRHAARPDDQVGVDDDELKRRPRVVRRLDYRFNGRGWTHDRKRQVDIVTVSTGDRRRLTNPSFDHSHVGPAPDGEHVVVISQTDDDVDLVGGNRVWLVPTDGTQATLLTPEPGDWDAVEFLADGRIVAIGWPEAPVLTLSFPYLLDPTGAEPPVRIGTSDVNCTALIGGATPPQSFGDGIVTSGIRGTTITVDLHDIASGTCTTLAGGDHVIGSFAVSGDPTDPVVVAAVSTPTRPAELWRFAGGSSEVLVSLNDELLAELDLAVPELVSVPSTEGAMVEAFVVRPPASAEPNGAGLLYIHGGPVSTYTQSFFDEFQMAAADGYTVVAGNPRGSDGYGVEWARSIIGHLGERDWADITALTDHLAGLDGVDPERIGIGGGSYGGFMTSWAIGHTTRYRAALVERAVTNWESFVGTSDIGTFFLPMLIDATVEDDLDGVRRQSPMTYAGAIETPTLILHSEEDWRCPIEQAEQLFAALRRRGVDVTLARFPGENHELSRSGAPRHRVERLHIVHDFFATHLKDGPAAI